VALVAVMVFARAAAAGHPEPRPGITAERVLPDVAIPRMPGALEAYAAARAVPAVLDGVYCHCDCSKHAGHRSLLTCFQSDHGAYCDICMGEAMLAAQLAGRGTSLQDIRAAIDARF
jgi:uncharacterized protein with PCYCGC motif